MPNYRFDLQRLYVEQPLELGANLTLNSEQSHYVLHVLRLKAGAEILLFNGSQGEWLGQMSIQGKRGVQVKLQSQTREQTTPTDVTLCFAPIRQARMDMIVEKAVELGAAHIVPIFTQYTQIKTTNTARLKKLTIEAAEQCGILTPPTVHECISLKDKVLSLPKDHALVFCFERADEKNPIDVLKPLEKQPMCVLIGPEGGFSEEEQAWLLKQPNTVVLSLGPRILRAETAALSALTLVQAVKEFV